MCASFETFLSSFIQCSIGFPYFFSIDGKYEAGPVTFFSATLNYTISVSDLTANSLSNAAPRYITESSNIARGE